MVNINVNDRIVKAQPGEYILQVLKREGIRVPTLCNLPDLFPSGACRLCVVEIEGMPGLVPSCAYPVSEGMKIRTHTPRALRARKTIIELLCANHPDDCLYCVRNGNCELQNLAEELGVRERRYSGKKANTRSTLPVRLLYVIRTNVSSAENASGFARKFRASAQSILLNAAVRPISAPSSTMD